MATKQHQFTGKRAVALKLLLDCAPRKALDSILEHVGSLGWGDCVWTEEALANKKVYPKHQFSSKSKKWASRIRTTDESMILMVERVQNSFEAVGVSYRFKISPSALEGTAERAAACLSLAAELQMSVPIPEQKIQEEWVAAWRLGSDHIDTELQALLLEKSDSFDPALHVPTLKRLVDEHVFSTPTPAPEIAQQALNVDAFNLLIKQLNYDVTVYQNWEKKCSTVLSARYHKEQDPWPI